MTIFNGVPRGGRLAIMAIAVASVLPGASCAAPQVTLAPQAEARAGVVTLGQIAVVQAAEPAMEARLRALPVARLNANAPGRLLPRLELERIVARGLGQEAGFLTWAGAQAVMLQVRRAAPGPMVVARRDAVTASSVEGPVRVELPAVALAGARAGDVIGVRLPNGAIVRAQVQGPGKVAL
jgi:flagella basal body P-ring formation protein FlgA